MDKDDTFSADPLRAFPVPQGSDGARLRTIAVGMQLVVEPRNPQKLKHRGRVGTVTQVRLDYLGVVVGATLKFRDQKAGGRPGHVDVDDLRPLTPQEQASLAQGVWPVPRVYEPRPVELDDGPRESALTRRSFSPEVSRLRPPLEDVERLWSASVPLDAPELASDPAAQVCLEWWASVSVVKRDLRATGLRDLVRWLPMSEAFPCTWWGAASNAGAYRLALRAYEPDGSPSALVRVLSRPAVSKRTGALKDQPVMRWPRPWRTDGLLLANEVSVALLRGASPPGLQQVFISQLLGDFFDMASMAAQARAPIGVIFIPPSASLETLQGVPWPKGVRAVLIPKARGGGQPKALQRLQRTLGPDVPVVDFAVLLAHARG